MSNIVSGVVQKIIFNNDSFYIVAIEYEDDSIVVTGNFNKLEEGQHYEFEGEFVEHAKYGMQFKAYTSNLILPSDEDLVVSYFSGKQFKGIGKKTAADIYKCYEGCDDILSAIIQEPERLKEVKGLNEVKIVNLIKQLSEHTNDQGLFKYLSNYQIDYNDVINVYNRSGLTMNEFIEVLQKDPYLLLKNNVNYKQINKFAHKLELEDYDFYQKAGYLYSLVKQLSFKTGSTYVLLSELNVEDKLPELDDILRYLSMELMIVVEDDHIYEYEQYKAEKFIGQFISEYNKTIENKDITSLLESYENNKGITFNEEQIQAIKNTINNSISIITGGPGTGKSTVVDALITIFKQLNNKQRICLVAPTGRASKRLSHLTGEKSMTIHKLLKYDMHKGTFSHDIFNPLEYDIIIIDEASMVDNLLMSALLKASFNVKKIIILGDYNQLPSVAEGQVLKDFIDSKVITTTFLNTIYRQKEGSKVIEFAYKILNKETITEDFFNDEIRLIDLNDNKQIGQLLKDYALQEDKDRLQILSPIYKGKLGIDNLNKNVQRLLFGDQFEKFNIDDRVIQLKNRNEDEIYNGDIGEVIAKSNNKMIVAYEQSAITYKNNELMELNIAYCISVHKAQGNEYDKVIVFIPDYYLNFVDNKILYTAITRAKKELVIVTNLDILNNVIQNTHHETRKTNLKQIIQKRL